MSKPVPPAPQIFPNAFSSIEDALRGFGALVDTMQADPEFASTVLAHRVGNPITIKTVPDVADWVHDQIQGVQNSAAKWVKGVQSPSADFKAAAIAAAGKHKQRTMEALNEDRFAKGMAKVDVDQAIKTAVSDGGSGFVNGVVKRQAKIEARVAQLQPLVGALKKTIQNMKQDTDADREARMIAAKRGMQEIGKRLRS